VRSKIEDVEGRYIKYAAKRLRRFARSSGPCSHCKLRRCSDRTSFALILAGLLALDCGWKRPFGKPFKDALATLTPDEASSTLAVP